MQLNAIAGTRDSAKTHVVVAGTIEIVPKSNPDTRKANLRPILKKPGAAFEWIRSRTLPPSLEIVERIAVAIR